jgi:hypothetical protein
VRGPQPETAASVEARQRGGAARGGGCDARAADARARRWVGGWVGWLGIGGEGRGRACRVRPAMVPLLLAAASEIQERVG